MVQEIFNFIGNCIVEDVYCHAWPCMFRKRSEFRGWIANLHEPTVPMVSFWCFMLLATKKDPVPKLQCRCNHDKRCHPMSNSTLYLSPYHRSNKENHIPTQTLTSTISQKPWFMATIWFFGAQQYLFCPEQSHDCFYRPVELHAPLCIHPFLAVTNYFCFNELCSPLAQSEVPSFP